MGFVEARRLGLAGTGVNHGDTETRRHGEHGEHGGESQWLKDYSEVAVWCFTVRTVVLCSNCEALLEFWRIE